MSTSSKAAAGRPPNSARLKPPPHHKWRTLTGAVIEVEPTSKGRRPSSQAPSKARLPSASEFVVYCFDDPLIP